MGKQIEKQSQFMLREAKNTNMVDFNGTKILNFRYYPKKENRQQRRASTANATGPKLQLGTQMKSQAQMATFKRDL